MTPLSLCSLANDATQAVESVTSVHYATAISSDSCQEESALLTHLLISGCTPHTLGDFRALLPHRRLQLVMTGAE